MKKICILTDFDGTVTQKDTLYNFFEQYAVEKWKEVEQDWVDGKISSKDCLIKEFNLVPDLNEKLIDDFLETVKIDEHFQSFYNYITSKNTDIFIVSDGVDYFINHILKKHNLDRIKIFSNHGKFIGKQFVLDFPNDNKSCLKDSGTCKCKVLQNLRTEYSKIIYIGDGVSDFCVADKADYLFAKTKLYKHCTENNIPCTEYNNFKDIQNSIVF